MNREDIIRMAREAGFTQRLGVSAIPNIQIFDRFAALVRADEREACAKLCDVVIPGDEYSTALINSYAAAIRARGQE